MATKVMTKSVSIPTGGDLFERMQRERELTERLVAQSHEILAKQKALLALQQRRIADVHPGPSHRPHGGDED